MMINTDKTFCTYENIYYEMWEIAGRYTEIAQFQVIGKSHDDRMIPMVQIGKGAETVFCIAGLSGTGSMYADISYAYAERICQSMGMPMETGESVRSSGITGRLENLFYSTFESGWI